MFVSVAITFYSFALCAAKVPLGQCSRVSLLKRYSLGKPKANFWRKNQLYNEARWFFSRGHRAVSLQVVPFLRDCKGKGYGRDRRADQTKRKTSEFIDSFRSKEITDIGIVNEYFELIDFHAALRYHLILKKLFPYLSRCNAVITMTLLLLYV